MPSFLVGCVCPRGFRGGFGFLDAAQWYYGLSHIEQCGSAIKESPDVHYSLEHDQQHDVQDVGNHGMNSHDASLDYHEDPSSRP